MRAGDRTAETMNWRVQSRQAGRAGRRGVGANARTFMWRGSRGISPKPWTAL